MHHLQPHQNYFEKHFNTVLTVVAVVGLLTYLASSQGSLLKMIYTQNTKPTTQLTPDTLLALPTLEMKYLNSTTKPTSSPIPTKRLVSPSVPTYTESCSNFACSNENQQTPPTPANPAPNSAIKVVINQPTPCANNHTNIKVELSNLQGVKTPDGQTRKLIYQDTTTKQTTFSNLYPSYYCTLVHYCENQSLGHFCIWAKSNTTHTIKVDLP